MKRLDNIRVGLVFPSYQDYDDKVSFGVNKQHLGYIPPLSLAYIGALLKEQGCTVMIIDASALQLTKKQVAERLKEFQPDFLGFTSTTVDFHCTLSWIRYLKEQLKMFTIIGGIHLSVYPRETMGHACIDYAVIGEAEETLPELLACLSQKGDVRHIKGIAYRDNGHIIITEGRNPVKNLDLYPFPARDLLANDRYYSFISKEKKFTAMLTSRGCPFDCIFCDSQTVSYRFRSAQSVVDEMEECVKVYGIQEIDIFDALFSISIKRVMEICKEINKRKLKFKWSFRTRVDLVTEEMLDELKRSGCIRIYYGIESGDETILKNINKHIDIDTIRRVVTLTKKKGIDVLGYFMIGNIGETHETVKKTLNLMCELPFDYVQISPVFAPPRTTLYNMIQQRFQKDFWKEYTLNPSRKEQLPLYGTTLSNEEVERYIHVCYFKFYLRAKYIIKFICQLRSLNELFRSIHALKDIIVSYYRKKNGKK
ncbi:MAG: B12-binding domain-containing radical SAM protein [Candidatus Omnitrophica bacterium]|nr:B12-binding domain-containing radical SAM protein [Candidatus Omnitrophota bacterium]